MPFTLAHPAACVPFVRCRLLLSALVAGSLAPDFLYFATLSTASKFGHTLPGVFVFSLPAALVALWLFHAVLKQPLLSLLPESHRRRLTSAAGEFRFGPPRRFALIVASVLVGIVTHVAWDGFTHSYGLVVKQYPVLAAPLGGLDHVRVCMVLHHASTLVGAILLGFWYVRWLRRAPIHPDEPDLKIAPAAQRAIVLMAVLGAGLFGVAHGFLDGNGTYYSFIACSGVAAISIAALEVLAFALLWQFITAVQAHRSDHPDTAI